MTRIAWQRWLCCAAVGSIMAVVRGGDADGAYLSLYNDLRKAEQLEQQGNREQACDAFHALHGRLLDFQRAYPSWHPEVVAFRLRTISAGLQRLCPEPTAESPAAGDRPTAEVSAEDLLRVRLRQLEWERDELKAKLREALAARPAPVDSPELAQAEERMRALEKEVALLRFTAQSNSLTREQPAKQPIADAGPSPQEQVKVLREELELERQKVAALEATAAALGARLVDNDENPHQGSPPVLPPSAPQPSSSDSAVPNALEQGRALLRAGQVDEAILVLGRGAQSPEANAELLAVLSRAFLSKGLIDPAEAVARRALTSDASCAEAHRIMAKLCLRRTPPARSLARWHYHEARRHGLTADPALETLLSDAPTDPS